MAKPQWNLEVEELEVEEKEEEEECNIFQMKESVSTRLFLILQEQIVRELKMVQERRERELKEKQQRELKPLGFTHFTGPCLHICWEESLMNILEYLEPERYLLIFWISSSVVLLYWLKDTSNSLLLDAWWLEFWEIVLLAAGDVESNPGPNQISDEQLAKVDNGVLGIDHLPCVLDSVIKCHEKWFNLCLALYVPYSKLAGIEMSHHDPTTCLREGLAVWLKGDYSEDQHGTPSWRTLVAAVDNSSGGNHTALALEIAKNHMTLCEVGDAFKSSSPSPTVHNDPSSIKKGKEMSSAFSRLYRSLRRELRVDVEEVKDVVRYSSNPHSLCECLVPPEAYEGATSTKDLLKRLYPTYINPQDTFLLEEIVENCGSRTCKRLLREYTNKFF